MELIRNWIIGVTCAAMLVAIADCITPAGTVKKLGKLTGGVVLLLAVLQPLVGLDYEALSQAMIDNQADLAGYSTQDGITLSAELMKSIIAEQTGAYILDKATALGVDCAVEVECKLGEGDLPYPVAVTVAGTLTEDQREALTREIEANLAIPAEMQSYEGGEME